MKYGRLLGDRAGAVYHCVTRTVNGEMLFSDKDLWVLRAMLRRVAGFCGVEVIAYALMHNHLHVMVRVSERSKYVGDDELLRRYRMLYPKPTKYQTADIEVMRGELERDTEEGARIRERLKARMGDLAGFMKTLKQRFSIYYNQHYGRFGTLWAERYKSVLVEDTPAVLRTVALYIDLNPTRAGLVEDPKDYPFCSYADAVVGDRSQRAQYAALFAGTSGAGRALAAYRECLFRWGRAPKADGSGGRISEKAAKQVIEREGELSAVDHLSVRVRYLTHGLAVGTQEFVQGCLQRFVEFVPQRRQRGPCDTHVEAEVHLFAMRRGRKPRK